MENFGQKNIVIMYLFFSASEDKNVVEKKRKEIRKKRPESSLSINEIPLDKDCDIFLGGYGE